MSEVKFRVPAADHGIITQIAARAYGMDNTPGKKMLDWRMDITACHANGRPLKLDQLLAADDFNFAHDVFGIRNNLDRDTGKLLRLFRPRYARPEPDAAA